MNDIRLEAVRRNVTGSNANKKLRREELVPGVLYQRDEDNVNLSIVAKDFDKVINEAGTSAIITLDIEGEEKKVLIRDYQRHPFKNMFVHADFLGVNMDETLRVSVPIVLLNRDDIHLQPSILIQSLAELDIECLPGDIPSQVEIDVQDMQYGDTITVDDLDITKDEKITIHNDLEETIASLQEPKEEEDLDEEVEDVDAADVEVIGEEDDDEDEVEEE